ncbi:MAG TPA: hypothetical protein VG015_01690, partial [Candidatus Dormibacteraeota bacterium]|nr:hypothetical protein [Candidatus Dormibacteraeota bacterium]
MIHRYLEAFFRNRWLVAIPVFVALSVGALYGYSQPRLYQAQSSLWFDQPVAVNPSSSYQTYADQGVSVITELLATKTVDMNIAKEGPLDQYLQTPKTDLMSKISGKVSHLLGSTSTSGPVDPTTLQNAVESVLQDPKELKVSSTGPEVVGIS